MIVDVTVGVPDPDSVDLELIKRELPHGEVTVHAVSGGLRVPGSDTPIGCAAITVSARYPENTKCRALLRDISVQKTVRLFASSRPALRQCCAREVDRAA